MEGKKISKNNGMTIDKLGEMGARNFSRMDKKRFTLGQGLNDDTLYEGEWDYLIDGFPIYNLIFNEIPETDTESNAFGLSDIVPMMPQLKELSLLSSAMLRHRKRAGTLLIGKKGNITEMA